ncbi:ABC transporter substrate-binding protein [Actinoplanes regularis]|uniref:ABC-type branched-chain amino acid transport system, substrate-binding protein n=1 Tax=Actinoplanes regularis TaxID=52697 RepID=A0A238Y491_9ACTN|nr:ABC transporter substrate-binding protein [Actinoplanes regularis]GIE86224.1 hypothetical protein Are01nite_27040 [Actinoplanes regularis]SNR65611.1 ABC-type branched-chain amino acid transport system, substrate-binding protein [Actinoplanes regularis]
MSEEKAPPIEEKAPAAGEKAPPVAEETPPIKVELNGGRGGRRRLVTALAATVVLVVLAGIVYRVLRRDPDPPQALCPGLTTTHGDGFALTPHGTVNGPECVGWLIDDDYRFGSTDTEVNDVLGRIVQENIRVRDDPAARPYVRIGLLMPMTATQGSALAAAEIRNSLQGAYAAQVQANTDGPTALGDARPWFQLVLINEATDQSGWRTAVDALVPLTGGAHPLVAVTGLGISIPATAEAGKRLGELRIPSIGSVVTADDMTAGDWMFKVSPSNRQYAAALDGYLDSLDTRKPVTGFLVWDRNPDNYVATLRTALIGEFGVDYNLDQHNQGFNGSKPPHDGTPQLFTPIVRDICAVDPDIIFYSGRDRDLRAFVEALGHRGQCQRKVRPILLATGATGLTITERQIDAAQVGILDAASTDLAGWRRNVAGTPAEYAAFAKQFAGLGFPDKSLDSGYAIMQRDAVVAAIWATRRDIAAKTAANGGRADADRLTETTNGADVRNALFSSANDTVPAASGRFYFREKPGNDLWPLGRPVPVIRFGKAATALPAPALLPSAF